LRLEELVKATSSRVDTVRVVRTAVNPLLWLVGLVTPLSIVSAVMLGELWIRIVLLSLAFLPVLITAVAYFVYMFRDPDRLQSEEYRLRRDALVAFKQGASPEMLQAAEDFGRLDSRTGRTSDGDPR
jgi:hypothetical protein